MEIKCNPEIIAKLRKSIYIMESQNIRDKDPKKDSIMVEKIIKEIQRRIDSEE